MYSLLRQLYTKHCGYPQYNIAILGLQQTGKTQMIKALKDETSQYMVGLKQQYRATIGLNTTQVNKNKMKFLVWDLGGKQSIRKIWENYYPYCHGVVFIFDQRVSEGLQCLKSILFHQQMPRIPILVFVRSSELYSQIQEQINRLNGSQAMEKRSVHIQLLPHNRPRLYQHLQWLYDSIRKVDIQIRK